MIDPKKIYRTREGRPVRIYAVDGGGAFPVHGAFWDGEVWSVARWTKGGDWPFGVDSNLALIEVKPRIKREVWVNVYPEARGIAAYRSREYADECACEGRIACVSLTIDCEEGEGL